MFETGLNANQTCDCGVEFHIYQKRVVSQTTPHYSGQNVNFLCSFIFTSLFIYLFIIIIIIIIFYLFFFFLKGWGDSKRDNTDHIVLCASIIILSNLIILENLVHSLIMWEDIIFLRNGDIIYTVPQMVRVICMLTVTLLHQILLTTLYITPFIGQQVMIYVLGT